jgi:chitinase
MQSLDDWNPAVGDDCINLWLNEAYCVGVSSSSKRDSYLSRRSECTTVQVKSGDDCGSLAEECGISAADFTKYNSDDSLCSTLTPGQHVCCSDGDMPDFKPKENANGTCYAYTIQQDDNCANIGAQYDLTNKEIEEFNNGTTWGWSGCSNIPANLNICLSSGYPPMPNADSNALCGPTVPGTEQPTNGTKLADLNPCPLNACCDMWGQCGITPLYCTNVTGPSGNPGTAPENEISCISNCGTDIVNNDIEPSEFISVGYYESWNWDRPCLNMRTIQFEVSSYTHIHWAFATIGDDYTVIINDTYKQWDDFKALDVKRIVSLGGWGYSTDQSTYDKLREAMSPDNRETFAKNIIQFLEDEGLDGVDFDWEYPGVCLFTPRLSFPSDIICVLIHYFAGS